MLNKPRGTCQGYTRQGFPLSPSETWETVNTAAPPGPLTKLPDAIASKPHSHLNKFNRPCCFTPPPPHSLCEGKRVSTTIYEPYLDESHSGQTTSSLTSILMTPSTSPERGRENREKERTREPGYSLKLQVKDKCGDCAYSTNQGYSYTEGGEQNI